MPDLTTTTDALTAARQEGDALILKVSGEIDLHTSPDLRTDLLSLLQKTQARKLVLNLADVKYMDSSAVAVMVEAVQRLRKVGGSVCLTNLQPRVQGLLEMTRVNSIFTLCRDEAEALAR